MLTSRQFGAKGDGVSDDTSALQAALDAAAGGALRLEAGRFRITATLAMPSATLLEGAGAVVALERDDVPAIASAAWLGLGATRGHTVIRSLRIDATGKGAGQHGVVLHDFWSQIVDVEVLNSGGHGIMLAHATQAGALPTGTLVENRILGCTVREAGGSAFRLGEAANGKLTDGAVRNAIAWLAEDNEAPALHIGHAAGWTVDGLHSYGGRPEAACHIENAYFANISNLYVERFGGAAIRLANAQTGAALSNVQILGSGARAGSAYIAISAHRDYARPAIHLANITLWHEDDGPAEALRIDAGEPAIAAVNVAIAGPGAGRLAPGALPVRAAADAQGPRRQAAWTGRGPQRILVDRQPAGHAFHTSRMATIAARAGDGGLVSSFAAMISWSRSDGRADVALADMVPLKEAQGFLEPPTLELERDDDGLSLLLVFTPAASGPGHATII